MTDTITISKEEYLHLKVAKESMDRFWEWDISENWCDYNEALYNIDHDPEEALPIDKWQARLRLELFGEEK